MWRKEKIYFEIDKRKYRAECPFDYEDAFKRGVEWADKHPKYGMVKLDKVIKWLQENTVKNFDNKNLTMLFESTIDMIDNFHKAMEE